MHKLQQNKAEYDGMNAQMALRSGGLRKHIHFAGVKE